MLINDLLSTFLSVPLSYWALTFSGGLIVYWTVWIIYARHFHPLASIPGPFWASITPLWYQQAIRNKYRDRYQLAIHQKYGPFVRLTPNDVSTADPEAIEAIYSAKAGMMKTEFYEAFASRAIGDRRDLFTDRDEVHHAHRRKIVASFYTQASVLEYEPRIGNVIDIFCKQMDKFAESGEIFDMSVWLRKYTFDVIGTLFYGKDDGFGFIKDNTDYNGWMNLLLQMAPPVSSLAYLPWGFTGLYMMSQMLWSDTRKAMLGFYKVQYDAEKSTNERIAERAAGKAKNKKDVLNGLLDVVETRGPELNFKASDVAVELWTTIWAGSDTTAFTLTSLFYMLMKNPDKLDKLLNELESAFSSGALSEPVRYNDAIKLPYLRACVTEAMRIHPALGSMLPRYVPKGGAMIAGKWFAGGTRVGVNMLVVHHDEALFGKDASEYVPERWLRCSEREAAYMERHLLTFGYGARVCIG
jgi:cytochrome P450